MGLRRTTLTSVTTSERDRARDDVFPVWVHIVVVLWVLALLGWSVVRFGPEGYPLSFALIGVLGLYKGTIDRLGRERQEKRDDPDDEPQVPVGSDP